MAERLIRRHPGRVAAVALTTLVAATVALNGGLRTPAPDAGRTDKGDDRGSSNVDPKGCEPKIVFMPYRGGGGLKAVCLPPLEGDSAATGK